MLTVPRNEFDLSEHCRIVSFLLQPPSLAQSKIGPAIEMWGQKSPGDCLIQQNGNDEKEKVLGCRLGF
jgi:hypothetical protein